MLTNARAQKLCEKWRQHIGSALDAFGVDGIWKSEYHLLYLNEVQEQIDLSEMALVPFDRPRKDEVELEQLKHFFEQVGLKNGIRTVWHKDFYGQPIPFLAPDMPDIPGMKKIKRLV